MPRYPKVLDISNDYDTSSFDTSQIHFDKKNNILAEEHYGYYLVVRLTKSQAVFNSNRLYLSYKHKEEFYNKLSLLGNIFYNRKPKKTIYEIYDDYKNYKNFVVSMINQLFLEQKSLAQTTKILRGLSLFLNFCSKKRIYLNNILDIKKVSQKESYNVTRINEDIKCLYYFYSQVSFIIDDYEIELKAKNNSSQPLKSLSSGIIYQIEVALKKDMEESIHKVNEYNMWINIQEKNNLFSIENVSKTFIDELSNDNGHKNFFINLLKQKLIYEYGIKVGNISPKNKIGRRIDNKEYDLINNLSIGGKNLLEKTEKMHALWHKELFPNWPYCKKVNKIYCEVKDIVTFRGKLNKLFEIKGSVLEKRIYPKISDIYNMILLLMLKTGTNFEVLLDLKVKNENNKYSLLSDTNGFLTIIDSTKNRSNSEYTIVLKNDSFEKKCLDFYINWLSKTYQNTGVEALFQYINFSRENENRYSKVENGFFTSARRSPDYFFKRNAIYDKSNRRIEYIDHRRLRPSHNYQCFLNGKSEYERQQKKNHKSGITTKNHYENDTDWRGIKKHRISLTQDLLVGVFKGEIKHSDTGLDRLFNGPLADCRNNKEPTFTHAPELKSNEYCSNWTKCLTLCDKSCVIPKVHGPVIYAWIEYLEEQKELFKNIMDWEKEFENDYEAAVNTIQYFTEEEKLYSKDNAFKHRGFVRMKFKTISKVI